MAERRIPAADFWSIVDLVEAAKEASVEGEKWQKAYAKSKGRFLDEINFITGAIAETLPDGSLRVTGHMDQGDLDVVWGITEKVGKMNRDVTHKVQKLAGRFRVFPDQIDIRSGVVSEARFETIKEPTTETSEPKPKKGAD
ncbi:hypothetical protein LCGC14_2959310 [marine sediment metagenome]|uniref:Uncharacterized protein n=1 Tax=marine sediment metagenome TaxID=412755 RepID=A0A0F8ZKJ4_9ZZZZ